MWVPTHVWVSVASDTRRKPHAESHANTPTGSIESGETVLWKARAVHGKAGAVLGRAGAVLGRAGAVLGRAGAVFGKAGAVFGKAGAVFGKAGAVFGKAGRSVREGWAQCSGRLGGVFGKAGAVFGKAGAVFGKAGAVFGKAGRRVRKRRHAWGRMAVALASRPREFRDTKGLRDHRRDEALRSPRDRNSR